MGFQSFLNDMSDLMRRRKEDIGKRQSLFEGLGPGNVGNVFEISPSQAQFANTYNTNAYGEPVRVLEVVGEDMLGEMICVSIQQETVLDNAEEIAQDIQNDTVEGPLVGIAEFGAGAGLGFVEFDIPTPVIDPGFVNISNGNGVDAYSFSDKLLPGKRINGVLLTLPASSLRIYVRNDANVPYLIQGGAGTVLPAVSVNENKRPAKIRVHATYGRRPYQSKLTRTIPVCFNLKGVNGVGPTQGMTFNGNDHIMFMIPPYATAVRFPRAPMSQMLNVAVYQSSLKNGAVSAFHGTHVIPALSEGPIALSPLDTFISMANPGPSVIANMNLVFELGI